MLNLSWPNVLGLGCFQHLHGRNLHASVSGKRLNGYRVAHLQLLNLLWPNALALGCFHHLHGRKLHASIGEKTLHGYRVAHLQLMNMAQCPGAWLLPTPA